MKDILSIDNKKALIIIAHPDDETVFCGGTMLCYPRCEWTIVCVTNEGDGNALYSEFEEANNRFSSYGVNIKPPILGRQRRWKKGISKDEENILKLEWKAILEKYSFSPDIVFTHGRKGEYGNKEHQLLNEVVESLFPNAWEFVCPGASACSQFYKDKIEVVPLEKKILDKKTKIFNRSYTSQLDIWRSLNNSMLYEFKTGPEIFTSN